jgi:hypothetical protein
MLDLGGRLVLAGILVTLSVAIALTFAGGDAGRLEALAITPLVLPLVLVMDLFFIWLSTVRLRRFEWVN